MYGKENFLEHKPLFYEKWSCKEIPRHNIGIDIGL